MENTLKNRDKREAMSVLVIDDDGFPAARDRIPSGAGRLSGADRRRRPRRVRLFQQERPVLVITDLQMPGQSGLEVLDQVKALDAEALVIVITAYGTIEQAVAAMKKGASRFPDQAGQP